MQLGIAVVGVELWRLSARGQNERVGVAGWETKLFVWDVQSLVSVAGRGRRAHWCTEHGPGEKSMLDACDVGDGFKSWDHHLVAE